MRDYNTYVNYICSILGELKKDKTLQFTEKTALLGDAGLSSLQVMELIEMIEDHFDISVPLNVLPDVKTVADFARKLADLV